jgi:thiol-disulfide isomerase/thioredoxin
VSAIEQELREHGRVAEAHGSSPISCPLVLAPARTCSPAPRRYPLPVRDGVGRCAVALGLVLLLAGCSSTAGSSGTPLRVSGSTPADAAQGVGVTRYAEGARPTVPDLSGTTLDGSALTLSSLRGSVVVLNVWASWCEPCRDESPLLAKVATATRSAGVRFVGIDEQDRTEAARAFAATAGADYPHIVDSSGSLLASLRIVPSSGIPSTLVLDRRGAVAARVIGPVDPATFEQLVRSVAVSPSSP